MKKFNITGLCGSNKHYMVNTTDKLNKIQWINIGGKKILDIVI